MTAKGSCHDVDVNMRSGSTNLPRPPDASSPLSLLWMLVKNSALIVISTIVVFAALRNSITYHLQHFWGASGNFWQLQWDKVITTFTDDQRMLWVYGTSIVTYSIYWGLGAIYTFLDVTNFPGFLRRYKIQPGVNEPVDTWKLIKCIFWVNFNQIVVGVFFLEGAFQLLSLRGFDTSSQLPTFHLVLFQLAVCILVHEVGFYYSHRLFHHRRIYKYFHKMHHEWQSPISVTAIYAHPLEHLIANLSPIFGGALIVGMHVATFWLWGAISVFYTLVTHSGYHLPFLPSPEMHDYHHLKFTQNYGTLGILDFLHGTDANFRNTKHFMRHVPMMSLQPIRETFPDDQPKGGKPS